MISLIDKADLPVLWPDGIPGMLEKHWQDYRDFLLRDDANWSFWVGWYEMRLYGRADQHGYVEDEKLLVKICTQDNDWWEREASAINADIAAWVAEAKMLQTDMPATTGDEPVRVPPLVTASLQPDIDDEGRLALPVTPLNDDLQAADIDAALTGLKTALAEFGQALTNESNLDRRFVDYTRTLAELIPETAPPQDKLFALAHYGETLLAYQQTANQEWPPLLAARLGAIGMQFDRTMKAFPAWRDLASVPDHYTEQQKALTKQLAIELAETLESATEFTAPEVPAALRNLVPEIDPPDISDRLAHDQLESSNNVLKRMFEWTLWAKSAEGFVEGVEQTLPDEAKARGKEFAAWISKLPSRLPAAFATAILLSHTVPSLGYINAVLVCFLGRETAEKLFKKAKARIQDK